MNYDAVYSEKKYVEMQFEYSFKKFTWGKKQLVNVQLHKLS